VISPFPYEISHSNIISSGYPKKRASTNLSGNDKKPKETIGWIEVLSNFLALLGCLRG
jgi:hypothetical protein